MVGWRAAWWMGIVIGGVLIPAGLVIHGNSNYFWCMIRVFAIVAFTTLLVGLTALLISTLVLTHEHVGEITRYGNAIVDDAAFARAGTMHDFSYLGGLVGILTGGIAIYRQRRVIKSRTGTT